MWHSSRFYAQVLICMQRIQTLYMYTFQEMKKLSVKQSPASFTWARSGGSNVLLTHWKSLTWGQGGSNNTLKVLHEVGAVVMYYGQKSHASSPGCRHVSDLNSSVTSRHLLCPLYREKGLYLFLYLYTQAVSRGGETLVFPEPPPYSNGLGTRLFLHVYNYIRH